LNAIAKKNGKRKKASRGMESFLESEEDKDEER